MIWTTLLTLVGLYLVVKYSYLAGKDAMWEEIFERRSVFALLLAELEQRQMIQREIIHLPTGAVYFTIDHLPEGTRPQDLFVRFVILRTKDIHHQQEKP